MGRISIKEVEEYTEKELKDLGFKLGKLSEEESKEVAKKLSEVLFTLFSYAVEDTKKKVGVAEAIVAEHLFMQLVMRVTADFLEAAHSILPFMRAVYGTRKREEE